ncbi:MAG: AAA family ATPase [Verrucomicrobia bacterium]|nr:AAA family ATPase [Verrucomicrobiota bacterium]
MTKKRPAVGLEDFAKFIHDGYYYVDKTYVVKELLEKKSDVNLFTRPRRFGKTLLMDTLKCFFEIDGPKEVFDGLAISKEIELCERYQGKYPVIFITLKSVEGLTFEVARSMLVRILCSEVSRHPVLAASDKLTEAEKDKFQQMCRMDMNAKAADIDLFTSSLRTLSEFLYKHYGQEAIILIDEYDVPLAKAEQRGFYDEMVSLIRGLFDQTLKTNPYMKFAVMTGCLRIARESIFTGMNKVDVYTVLDNDFSDAFGYTDEEVRAMLNYFELSQHYKDVKDWYDGYQFGDKHIYCPWDVNKYCRKLLSRPNGKPEAFWMNTSGNDIIRKFIETSAEEALEDEVEELINGGSVRKKIHQELTYRELYATIDNIWSVLFTTGYLTVDGDPEDEELNLVIPNQGIRKIFKEQVFEWIKEGLRNNPEYLNGFCEYFVQGKAAEIEDQFNEFLDETISIRDSGEEKFYHAYLLGMLRNRKDWRLKSNVETGNGYCDISIKLPKQKLGILIEMKYTQEVDKLEEYCREALDQIERKGYKIERVNRTLKYGIACCRKECKVMLRE